MIKKLSRWLKMNKILFLAVLGLLIVSGCKFIGVSPVGIGVPKEEVKETFSEELKPYVDPEIYELLKTESKISVTIHLIDRIEEETNISKYSSEKEKINIKIFYFNALIDSVISRLPEEDFILIDRLELSPVFSGLITEKGLDKLKEDDRIKSIFLEKKIKMIPNDIKSTS